MRGLVSIRITSSANKLLYGGLWLNVNPEKRSWEQIDSAKGSIMRLNIDGDRGHPWQVPLVIGKDLEITPDVKTCADGVK